MSNVEYCDPAAPINSGHIVAGPQERKAGFWIRLAAWIADLVCLFLATIVLTFGALITIYLGGQLGGEINDQVIALAGYASAAIVLFSGVIYFTIFVGSCGQTPGKTLFRLKVVRTDDQEMTYGRALLRSLCWILSLLLLSLGFLMIAFTRQKRALHDMLAGTSVIRLPRTP
ncbi:MAG: RDD family protein [candidate division NC10 bacterium]|nr:RDD family protein [candidate division NC10 bacterium]MDE2322207.1 RDD family protein [candidate division NC10 bacterium]